MNVLLVPQVTVISLELRFLSVYRINFRITFSMLDKYSHDCSTDEDIVSLALFHNTGKTFIRRSLLEVRTAMVPKI